MVIIQKNIIKWKKRYVSTTSLTSVGTKMSAENNTFSNNVKIWTARPQEPATKGTQKGAENMIIGSVGLKIIVLTNM